MVPRPGGGRGASICADHAEVSFDERCILLRVIFIDHDAASRNTHNRVGSVQPPRAQATIIFLLCSCARTLVGTTLVVVICVASRQRPHLYACICSSLFTKPRTLPPSQARPTTRDVQMRKVYELCLSIPLVCFSETPSRRLRFHYIKKVPSVLLVG